MLTSPLERARATAELVAGELRAKGVDVELVADDRLIELDYGEYDGLQPSEVAPEEWARWRAGSDFRPPGGESLDDLQVRCDTLWRQLQADAVERVARPTEVIAVSHVSPIKSAVAWALGTGPEVAWRLQLSVASLTRIALGWGGPALVSFGETGHLQGEAT